MNTEYLGGNNGSDGKAVENVDKSLPRLDVTPSFTFIVEPVYCKIGQIQITSRKLVLLRTSCNIRTLMVSSEEEEVFGILDFVTQQEKDGFQTLLPAVDIITQEEIIGSRGETAHLEKANKV